MDNIRHQIMFNRIVERLTEQERKGKQDFILLLRTLFTGLLDNLDDRPLLQMFQQYDQNLWFVSKKFTYEQLELDRPSETEMEAHFELLVGDFNSPEEIYKSKSSKIKEVLVELNKFLVERKVSLPNYRAAYRNFADSIPE
jgi:hypothetical protein